MTTRRAVLWLAWGALGLALGLAAAIWDVVPLAVVAGACALAGGVAAYRLVGLVRERAEQVDHLSQRVCELESAKAQEAEARARAEVELDAAAFADQIERTAVRWDPDAESLTDHPTGLFSEPYFVVALDARITAARRQLRPVSVALLEVITGLGGPSPQAADAMEVTEAIDATLRESDTACRLADGNYALLLEDTPEDGAIWTVERLRRHLAEVHPGHTVWAGIACYPAHGLQPDEIRQQAECALDSAREWRQDRIEIATAD